MANAGANTNGSQCKFESGYEFVVVGNTVDVVVHYR